MPFDLRADCRPVRGKLVHKHHALRIADVQNCDLALSARKRQPKAQILVPIKRLSHIHLERESQTVAFEQAKLLDSRSGRDTHVA